MKGVTSETQEKLGGYNSMPPNVEFITESEFLWRVSYRDFIFRQVPFTGVQEIPEGWHDVYMFCNPDFSGVGYVQQYDGRAMHVTENAYTARYFKWTYCEHEFKTTHTGNCYWEGTCSKCGYHHIVDSSG